MFQLFNDGAVIRIENGTKTLLVTKEQVKTIDTIQNNIVRIDIGEGPLKNIFINKLLLIGKTFLKSCFEVFVLIVL